jgi:hypothetical protein
VKLLEGIRIMIISQKVSLLVLGFSPRKPRGECGVPGRPLLPGVLVSPWPGQ